MKYKKFLFIKKLKFTNSLYVSYKKTHTMLELKRNFVFPPVFVTSCKTLQEIKI